MKSRKTEFWKELVFRLKSRPGQKSAVWLARILEVPESTFFSWKERGQFRESLLPEVAEVLSWHGLDAEEARKLDAELISDPNTAKADQTDAHPTERALEMANKRYRGKFKSFRKYADDTFTKVISTLGDHCIFAFSGCMVSPFEFEDNEVGRAILPVLAKAICKGAHCLYIRPTDDGLTYYQHTWSFEQVAHLGESTKEIDAFRQAIKRLMVRGEVNDVPKMSPANADRLIYEQLDQCYVTRSPMWMPGFGLYLIGWINERHLKTRVAISLPGGSFGGPLVHPPNPPLEYRFTRFVRRVVTNACLEIHNRKEGRRSEGAVQLVLPDPEKYLLHSEKFYTRYSELMRSVIIREPQPDAYSGPDADRGQREEL